MITLLLETDCSIETDEPFSTVNSHVYTRTNQGGPLSTNYYISQVSETQIFQKSLTIYASNTHSPQNVHSL